MNSRKILYAAAAAIVFAAGIYFRTYALHPLRADKSPEALARRAVERSLSEQIRKTVDQEFPGISPEARRRVAEERVRQVLETDKTQFENAVKNAAESVRQSMPEGEKGKWAGGSGRHYLLEADPYYFYYQTRMILKTGRVSPQIKNGRFYNPLQRAPHGYWPSFTLHPYVGAAWYRLVHFLNPETDLMEALNCVPLVLVAAVIAVFFALASSMSTSVSAVTLGCLALVLSPIFIQRSAFGWYDTDPYNYIFPGLILASFFAGTRGGLSRSALASGLDRFGKAAGGGFGRSALASGLDRFGKAAGGGFGRSALASGLAAGFLTGLYALFWNGWPFIFVLTIACSITGCIAEKLPWGREREKGSLFAPFLFFYAGFGLLFAILFMTPAGFVKAIRESWTVSQQFALSKADLWPNIFLTVGEAQGISFKKMIFLIGNYVTVGLALLGWGITVYRAIRHGERQRFREWVILSAFTLPLIILSLRTERFCVLLVLPLAVFVTLGAEILKYFLQKVFTAFRSNPPASRWIKTVSTAAVFLIALPLQLVTAHVVAGGIHPIMNDAWFEVMRQLKEKTPADAIVNSWWPPGYFVSGLAERRTTSDGGTQHLKEVYWQARFLLTPDEGIAAGLLRMLNTSGNDAVDYLQSVGLDLPDAIDLIPEIVSVSRKEAAGKLPQKMSEKSKQHLLDLTHGRGSFTPAYILLYDDLMDQNLAVSMLASWDFRKARAFYEKTALARKQNGIFSFLKRPSFAAYLQEVFDISNGIMRYTPEAELARREGDILLFKNGLAVNLKDMTSYISLPEKKVNGQPMSFFYMKDGILKEQENTGEKVDASALLISQEGSYKSVVADPRLLRSLLFRLYYLNGEGLRFFKPFIRKYDPLTKTNLFVYEFDNTAFEKAAPST